MYWECFEKLQICIETCRTFIVIVISKLWGVTYTDNNFTNSQKRDVNL